MIQDTRKALRQAGLENQVQHCISKDEPDLCGVVNRVIAEHKATVEVTTGSVIETRQRIETEGVSGADQVISPKTK